jgi:hypothetical protein
VDRLITSTDATPPPKRSRNLSVPFAKIEPAVVSSNPLQFTPTALHPMNKMSEVPDLPGSVAVVSPEPVEEVHSIARFPSSLLTPLFVVSLVPAAVGKNSGLPYICRWVWHV